MGDDTVYSSGLTGEQLAQEQRNLSFFCGPRRESPAEIEHSWQEWRKKNPPLPPLRERFGIAANDGRTYLFLSEDRKDAFCFSEKNPRVFLPFSVAVDPKMTGRDIVRGLLGGRSPDLKEFGLVCLGGDLGNGWNSTTGGYSINLVDYLRDSMGIEPDRPVSETGIRFTPS